MRDMSAESEDLLKGTLDMLILKSVELAPMHGWGIGERIAQLSRGVFTVQTGTLYPALQKLLRQGVITAEWRTSDNGRLTVSSRIRWPPQTPRRASSPRSGSRSICRT